jgi:hypothetical protein
MRTKMRTTVTEAARAINVGLREEEGFAILSKVSNDIIIVEYQNS